MKVDKDFVARFNQVRIANQGKKFSRKELYGLLKTIEGFPKCDYLLSIMFEHGALVKYGFSHSPNTKWGFTKEPVHISVITECVITMKNYWISKYTPRVKKFPITEEACIEYLKSKGYKIFKEV